MRLSPALRLLPLLALLVAGPPAGAQPADAPSPAAEAAAPGPELRFRLPSRRYVPLPDSTRLALLTAPDSAEAALPRDPARLVALAWLRQDAEGYAADAPAGRYFAYALTSNGNVYATLQDGAPAYGAPGAEPLVLDLVRDADAAAAARDAFFSPAAEAALDPGPVSRPDTLAPPVAVTPVVAEEDSGIPAALWLLLLAVVVIGLAVWLIRRRSAAERPLPPPARPATPAAGSSPGAPAPLATPPGARPDAPPPGAPSTGAPRASADDLADLLGQPPDLDTETPPPAPGTPPETPEARPAFAVRPERLGPVPAPEPEAPSHGREAAELRAAYDALQTRHERLEAAFLDLARDYERFKRQTHLLLQPPPDDDPTGAP